MNSPATAAMPAHGFFGAVKSETGQLNPGGRQARWVPAIPWEPVTGVPQPTLADESALESLAAAHHLIRIPSQRRGLMARRYCSVVLACVAPLLFAGCAIGSHEGKDLVNDPFVDRQREIHEAVMSIKRDIEASNIEGLKAAHLESEKFTKFGPRSFERQDVSATNESEAAFFSSISNARYEVRDLKIDVFGDVGIATYYPEISFVRDGREVVVSGRQTLVFLKTDSGWKLVHEHGTVRTE